jgi:3-phenylpropionate/trans-cinnamate dioxygenase ferredoxin reductase subunit
VVVACGASPRALPTSVVDPELDGVHELRTVADCMALRASLEGGPKVVVIGAGFIGSEVAATSRSLGLDVTILEMLPIPLERALGPHMGATCGRLHTDNGVDLRLGVTVDRVEANGGGRVGGVRLGDGTVVDADVVVVGVGVAPTTGWLEGSGLTLRDGIVCDDRCVAAPGVVAAGDVARWFHPGYETDMRVEHWTNAAEQGAAAARGLLHGDDADPYRPVPYFWSDQYGTKIQFVGHRSGGDEVEVVEGSIDEGRFVATYRKDGKVTAVLLWNRAARIAHWLEQLEAGLSRGTPRSAS